MKPQAEPSTQEVLAGLVERVTYTTPRMASAFCEQKRAGIERW
jgi:hypothetical protein